MSKIGRRPISTKSVQIELKNQELFFKGPKGSGKHLIPNELTVQIEDGQIVLLPNANNAEALRKRDVNRVWGLHRAILANAISGTATEFEKLIEINGLGYKAVKTGDSLVFSLGFSHKINFDIPAGVTIDLDKTGQKLTVKASDKFMVGQVCGKIRALRPPEPYKGTGVKLASEVIIRKAGKTKS